MERTRNIPSGGVYISCLYTLHAIPHPKPLVVASVLSTSAASAGFATAPSVAAGALPDSCMHACM